MIPIVTLLYRLDQKLNKVASLQHQQIGDPDKIFALREATLKLIKAKADGLYGKGLDSSSERYMDLQNLIVPYTSLSFVATEDVAKHIKAELPVNYFLPVGAYVKAHSPCCSERMIAVEKIVRHADLQDHLDFPQWQPSFGYQSTIGTIENNYLKVYTENTAIPEDSFTADSLNVTYLRYPVMVDISGYTTLSNVASTTVDSDLAPHLEDELLDLTVKELASNTENPHLLTNNS